MQHSLLASTGDLLAEIAFDIFFPIIFTMSSYFATPIFLI